MIILIKVFNSQIYCRGKKIQRPSNMVLTIIKLSKSSKLLMHKISEFFFLNDLSNNYNTTISFIAKFVLQTIHEYNTIACEQTTKDGQLKRSAINKATFVVLFIKKKKKEKKKN